MNRLNYYLKNKRSQLSHEKALLHQDNTRLHKCIVFMAVFNELGNELPPHPPYFLYIVPNNYFLFLIVKKLFIEKRFGFNGEINAPTNIYFWGIRLILLFGSVELKRDFAENIAEELNVCFRITCSSSKNHKAIDSLPMSYFPKDLQSVQLCMTRYTMIVSVNVSICNNNNWYFLLQAGQTNIKYIFLLMKSNKWSLFTLFKFSYQIFLDILRNSPSFPIFYTVSYTNKMKN